MYKQGHKSEFSRWWYEWLCTSSSFRKWGESFSRSCYRGVRRDVSWNHILASNYPVQMSHFSTRPSCTVFEASSRPTLACRVGLHPRNAYQIMLCDKLPIFRNCMEIYGIIWVLIPELASGSLPKSLRTKDLASELFCLIIIWSGRIREECVHFFTPMHYEFAKWSSHSVGN